jgi:hypothetical integral membrane protein (TIGR02206 family)
VSSSLAAFGPAHLAIIAAVPAVAAVLSAWARRSPASAGGIRFALAAVITTGELAWYRHAFRLGWVDPPFGLPLDLCDVTLWLSVVALVTLRPWAVDAVYYLGIAGSGMAVLTPDVGAPFPSVAALAFFLSHGAVVAAILFLVWSRVARPRAKAWWRVLLATNAYAAAVAAFNAAFGTNYMYLMQKPESETLLDLLGPWPWYVLGGEVVAVALLFLLSLPLRRAT